MVISFDRFKEAIGQKELVTGTFFVAEQMSKIIIQRDFSRVLTDVQYLISNF